MTAGSMLPYHELSLKRAVDRGGTPGPRFLIAGPYLDGDASRNPMSLNVSTPEEARRAVEDELLYREALQLVPEDDTEQRSALRRRLALASTASYHLDDIRRPESPPA